MNKTSVTRGQAFRARLAAGDPAAHGLFDLVDSVGGRILYGNNNASFQSQIGDVHAVAKLENLYRKNKEFLKSVLFILISAGRAPVSPVNIQAVFDMFSDPLFKTVKHDDLIAVFKRNSDYKLKELARRHAEEKNEKFARSMVLILWKLISDDGMMG